MFSVFSFTLFAVGIILFTIGSLEGYQPLIHLPAVTPLIHYTNPVLFPSPALIQPLQHHHLTTPVLVPDGSASNVVRVLIHKEFKLQPNGEYRGITGETTRIIVPREEVEDIHHLGEREPRRISPANSISGYTYKAPQNSFLKNEPKVSENYKQETKSGLNPGKEDGGYGNSDDDTSKEEVEEENQNDESSEEATEDDETSGYSDKGENTKKDLQRDFFRSTNEKITSEDQSKISGEKSNDKPDMDMELLHTLSEQFLLSNGKLTQLNASDFTVVDKENEEPHGYYNYNVDDESKPSSKYGSSNNSSETTEILDSKEENEETEEYSAPSTENKSYSSENENREDEGENEFRKVVKTIIEQQIRPMRPYRGSESNGAHFKDNYEGRQVTPKPNFVFGSTGVNSRLQNSLTGKESQLPQNSMRQKLNFVQQIQSHSKQPTNFTYNDARNFKVSSPSFGYNSPSESQLQASAEKLNVFLFDAPRFSSLRSPTPTPETYNEIPASYTRRPLKLQRDPAVKSHFDRTLYQNLGNSLTTTRPTKSSRILFDNNEWHPITSRSNIQSPVPEKLRQSNSLTNTNSKIQLGSKTSSGRITPSFNSFSPISNKTKGNNKSATSHPVSIQDIIRGQKYESRPESKEGELNFNQSKENGNPPLFSLIDELTGVIQKHKDAATSSEEALTKSKPQDHLNKPSQFSAVRNNGPQREINTNLPRLSGDTKVNQFRNLAPSQSSQTFSTNFRDVRQNNTSAKQTAISNSTENKENQNEKLYYYSNDSRGFTTPSPIGRVKTIMAVRPYVPPHLQEDRKPKSPFRVFLNSLHALHEKNKNRHSHFHEHIVNSLNLRKPKSSSENLPNTPRFKLTPSIYPARPIYKVEPIPISQSPFPLRKTPQFVVSPINSEVEVVDQPFTNSNRGEELRRGFSHPLVLPAPETRKSQPIKSQDTDTKPKEYLGDKYARLGENLFYRVHHIFKQFVPPVLHIGSNEPPK